MRRIDRLRPVPALAIAIIAALLLLFSAWDEPPIVWWGMTFIGAIVSLLVFFGRGPGDAA